MRPHRQTTAKGSQSFSGKLAKRFYGPFKILARIGKVAYRLELPNEAKIHSVLHCSMLKPFRGSSDNRAVALPDQFVNHQPVITPMTILDYRRSNEAWEVLVQWHTLSPNDTSWEDWTQLQQAYHLEDKVPFLGPWSDKREEDMNQVESEAAANETIQGVATTATTGTRSRENNEEAHLPKGLCLKGGYFHRRIINRISFCLMLVGSLKRQA